MKTDPKKSRIELPREARLAEVWPEGIGTEATLISCVRRLNLAFD